MFDPYDVIEVMKMVVPYLKSEPMLIEDVPFDVAIVADIHGQVTECHSFSYFFRHSFGKKELILGRLRKN